MSQANRETVKPDRRESPASGGIFPSGATAATARRGPRPVVVHIEELVLHGFAPGDRHRIGEAVESELARLFAEQGTPPRLTMGGEIDRLDAGSFPLAASSRPEMTGAQVARAVFGGFRR